MAVVLINWGELVIYLLFNVFRLDQWRETWILLYPYTLIKFRKCKRQSKVASDTSLLVLNVLVLI